MPYPWKSNCNFLIAMNDKAATPIKGQERAVSVRQQLKQATHAAHVRLNQHPLLAGLTRNGFPLAQYRLILAAYRHFFDVMEPAILDCLAAGGEMGFSYADRRKTDWLAQDIAALGELPAQPAMQRQIPLPTDIAGLIGTLYAIEGSTLGGQVISRHLRANLGLTAENGARFFNAYGDETENRWAAFCVYAESIVSDPDQCRRAAEAALQVFNSLEELLDDCFPRTLEDPECAVCD